MFVNWGGRIIEPHASSATAPIEAESLNNVRREENAGNRATLRAGKSLVTVALAGPISPVQIPRPSISRGWPGIGF
jgi:hypothetical protein